MTTSERLGAVGALVGVLGALFLCVWLLIKLGTWIVVQFYGDHLGIEQHHVFSNPTPKVSTGDQFDGTATSREPPDQAEPT